MSITYFTVSAKCWWIVINAPISFILAMLACLVDVEPDESRQLVFDNARGELSEDTGLPDGGIRGGFADQRGFVCDAAQHRQGWSEDTAKGGACGMKVAVDANCVDIPAAGP